MCERSVRLLHTGVFSEQAGHPDRLTKLVDVAPHSNDIFYLKWQWNFSVKMKNLQESINFEKLNLTTFLLKRPYLLKLDIFTKNSPLWLHHAEQRASSVNCLSFVLELHARPRPLPRSHTHFIQQVFFKLSWAKLAAWTNWIFCCSQELGEQSWPDPAASASPQAAAASSQKGFPVCSACFSACCQQNFSWKGWKSHEFKIRIG